MKLIKLLSLIIFVLAIFSVNATNNNLHKHQKHHKVKHKRKSKHRYIASQKSVYVISNAIAKPRLYSYSAIALDANTGQILISKNPNAKLPIASITKLMTAIIVLDAKVNLEDYVTITKDDIDILKYTFSRLKVGLQFKRKDLLLLALMSSENRAAYALGRTTFPGGRKEFIQKMNAKAKELGMTNTVFYEPTGLYRLNRSTALDLSKLVQAAYQYDEIRQDTTTKNADVMFTTNYIHRYHNTDALVKSPNLRVELSKTGYINEAGHCLALYSIVNNKPVVMIFLNSAGKSGRLLDAIAVRNYVRHLRS